MLGPSASVGRIVATRHSRLPEIDELLGEWSDVATKLADLAIALESLPDNVTCRPQVGDAIAALRSGEPQRQVNRAEQAVKGARDRFARGTVNIGVSGQARVGKSTLLQSMTGLGDGQIPTGAGLPVTAVRSRIFHASSRSGATLQIHSYQSFLEEVLQPYHEALGLPPAPQTIEAFANFDYESATTDDESHQRVTELRRLRDMHQSLAPYRELLTSEVREKSLPLDDLRPFVAYPTASQLKEPVPPRQYLAVRDASIHTRFPKAAVEQLGIIDLPGLGEVAVGADEHHVEGLQNDVDVVVLVKRPVEGLAFWRQEDSGTVAVLDRAKGVVARRDFVFILVNVSENSEPELLSALRTSLLRDANGGTPDMEFRVFEADAASEEDVFSRVLGPILDHLASRLPAMDDAVLQEALHQSATSARAICALSDSVVNGLRTKGAAAPSERAEVSRRSRELHRDVAVALSRLVARLREDSRKADTEDEALVAAVNEAAEACYAWVDAGFGQGALDSWLQDSYRAMEVAGASGEVMAHGFNSSRVRIASEFSRLDNYFNNVKVPGLLTAIAEVLSGSFGSLVEPFHDDGSAEAGRRWLRALKSALEASPEQLQGTTAALDQLLDLRVEFRSLVYPRIRDRLDSLQPQQIDPETGHLQPQITVPPTEEGARVLAAHLARRTRQAAYNTMVAILEDAQQPARVLHAVAELFDDAFIRGEGSEDEFQAIGHAFRDDIWPGVFSSLESANKAIERARRIGIETSGTAARIQDSSGGVRP